jgi:hypothetical protein
MWKSVKNDLIFSGWTVNYVVPDMINAWYKPLGITVIVTVGSDDEMKFEYSRYPTLPKFVLGRVITPEVAHAILVILRSV